MISLGAFFASTSTAADMLLRIWCFNGPQVGHQNDDRHDRLVNDGESPQSCRDEKIKQWCAEEIKRREVR